MFGLLKKQRSQKHEVVPENDFSEAGLREALFSRLTAFERNGSKQHSYFHNKEIWGIDLATKPLFLLWNNDPKYYLTMRYFLGMYDVRGLMGGGLHIVPSTEADFRQAATLIPDLVAVIFGGEEHYEPLCRDIGVPFTTSRFADQYAFANPLPHQCAPYVRQNLTILDKLGDELSRRTLLGTQLFRLSLDPKWLAPIICGDQMYFKPGVFELGNDEIFIDGGGSLGDTVHEFRDCVNGNYQHIYSFEPGPIGAGVMRRMYKDEEKITVYELGMSSKAGTSGLSHQIIQHVGTVNGVVEAGAATQIKLEALDNLNLGKVTFIKLDIEGFEYDALQGARKTIQKYKPKLAICAYHKPDDFGNLYNLIKEIREDYTIYLRHYTSSEGDSVFYAV